jgi:hypothetical protein
MSKENTKTEETASAARRRRAMNPDYPDGLDLARRAVDLWGVDAQLDQVIEECAELILAIRHHRRGREPGRTAIANEVIDVEFMCQQVRVIIGSSCMASAEHRKMAKVIRKITAAEDRVDAGEQSP